MIFEKKIGGARAPNGSHPAKQPNVTRVKNMLHVFDSVFAQHKVPQT